jgi:hypothetical protein
MTRTRTYHFGGAEGFLSPSILHLDSSNSKALSSELMAVSTSAINLKAGPESFLEKKKIQKISIYYLTNNVITSLAIHSNGFCILDKAAMK